MRRLFLSVLVWVALLAMAPSVRAAVCVAGQPSTAGNAASSAVTSLALANPGAQAGDVLLVQIVVGDSNSWITPPSGWTYYSNDTRGSLTQMLFYRVAGASEPSSYSFSFGSARAVGGLLLLRGVSVPGNGNPIVHVQNNSGTSSTLTALSANVVSANSLVVRSFAWGNGNDALSGPATQHYTMATGAGPNGVAASSSSALSAGTGQSGNATATAGGSSDNWLAVTTVLAPGAGGGICSVSQVDHYELDYASNQALTCNPLAVTVRACANSSCSMLYGSPTSTIPSATNISGSSVGNWSPNSLTFTGNGNSNYRLTTAGLASLGISSASPTGSNPLRCVVGGVSGDNCLVSFADSGFILDVPNLLAAKPTAATLQAVRKDDASKACVPGFASGTRNVQFSRSYSSPITGTQPVVINGTPVTDATSVALTFDATASAALMVRYDDAGQMDLSASYTGSGEESGLLMTGSDNFVSKPYGLLLQTDTDSSCTADINCPLYPGVRAGDPFNLRIKAVAWECVGVGCPDEPLTAAALANNTPTPNFRLSNIALSSQVQAPSGGSNGTLGLASYDHVLGNQTALANQSISEVGVFKLTATPLAGSYLDGETVSGGESGLVGRFAPAYLDASGSASLTPACIPTPAPPSPTSPPYFSYQGQPMGFASGQEPSLTVAGKNRSDGITANYDRGSFWRLGTPTRDPYLSITGKTTLDAAGRLSAAGTVSVTVSGADSGNDGARSYRWSGEALTYSPALAPVADDLPFIAAVRQGFSAAALTDADGACYLKGLASCQAFSFDFTSLVGSLITPGSEVRLGRLHIGNAHGSELQPLNLPLRLESWQGTGGGTFQLESGDTCSAQLWGGGGAGAVQWKSE